MPAALQTKIAFKTSLSGSAFEALAAATGDSLTFYTIPGAGDGPVGWLAEIWGADSASVCEFSFTASRFHDQTYGLRFAVPAASSFAPTNSLVNLSPLGFDQPIYGADVMTVQANGTASDKAIVTWTEYYPNLPGIAFNGVTSEYVRANMRNLVGVNVQPTSGTCTWGTSVALNSQTDLLHKGRQYAVLGFTAKSAVSAVALQGIDTGNLRVGGVVTGDPKTDSYLFGRLADFYKQPLIPVIQANNSGAINVYAANLTGAAQVIDIQLAELTTTPIMGGGL
jgi:hypothetical protein